MTDYEMLYLKAKEKQYQAWLEKQREYEVFDLPFIIKQIEVQIEKTELPDMRENGSDD
jgi:hypothetical protein